jgi:hypothetical protein
LPTVFTVQLKFRKVKSKVELGPGALGGTSMKETDLTHTRIQNRGLALAVAASMSLATAALADEGGVSFWVPGLFGSLAAVPQQPGFSLAMIYYHTSVDAGGDVAFARQVSRGRITTNFRGNLNANLNADADLGLAIPTYTFESPSLGARVVCC